MSEPLRERTKTATELLAAASSSTLREAKTLYLAEARNVIVEVKSELAILERSLERMEADLARPTYVPKGEST